MRPAYTGPSGLSPGLTRGRQSWGRAGSALYLGPRSTGGPVPPSWSTSLCLELCPVTSRLFALMATPLFRCLWLKPRGHPGGLIFSHLTPKRCVAFYFAFYWLTFKGKGKASCFSPPALPLPGPGRCLLSPRLCCGIPAALCPREPALTPRGLSQRSRRGMLGELDFSLLLGLPSQKPPRSFHLYCGE